MRLQVAITELNERLGSSDPSQVTKYSVSQRFGVIPSSELENRTMQAKSLENYKVVSHENLVLNRFNAYKGALGLAPDRGVVSPDYFVAQINERIADPCFIRYFLLSQSSADLIKRDMGGMGSGDPDSSAFSRFDVRSLMSMKIPIDDVHTQRAIADYLDRETAEIDGMRADLDEMERLLTERRTAFIGSAVRQDSSHGEKVSLQSVASIHAGDTITSSEITEHGEYRVYGGNGVRGYCDRANQPEDRVLIGRQGALCGNVHLARGPFYASEHALVIEPRIDVCLDWLTFVLQDQKLGQLSMSAAQPGITASAVGLQRIEIPPLAEQRRIADEIDRETAEIDSMLEDITKLRDLLAERRAAVISAAVTGQIDIPVSPTYKDEPHA